MPGRRAGSPIAVYAGVQCQEPKTGQEKVQFYCEEDLLFLSSYYLSMRRNIQATTLIFTKEGNQKDKLGRWNSS